MSAGHWYAGNAADDGEEHRGWIVGHFMDDDVRRSEGVEIKWGIHAGGEERADWQGDESRTTVLLLVKGRFRVELSVGSFVLEREGDYAYVGLGHRPLLASRGGFGRRHREVAVCSARSDLGGRHGMRAFRPPVAAHQRPPGAARASPRDPQTFASSDGRGLITRAV